MLLDLGELLCEPLVLLCVCSFGEMAYTVKRKSQFEGQDKGIARTRKLIENMAIYWGKGRHWSKIAQTCHVLPSLPCHNGAVVWRRLKEWFSLAVAAPLARPWLQAQETKTKNSGFTNTHTHYCSITSTYGPKTSAMRTVEARFGKGEQTRRSWALIDHHCLTPSKTCLMSTLNYNLLHRPLIKRTTALPTVLQSSPSSKAANQLPSSSVLHNDDWGHI